MFSYITGDLVSIEADHLVVEASGIGYEIATSLQAVSHFQVGEQVKIYLRLIVREDGLFLYGFYNQKERMLYDLLTKVSSVGPKSALAILSTLSVDALIQAIQTNDIKSLSRSPGVGKKTASRIVLELVDKLKEVPFVEAPLPEEGLHLEEGPRSMVQDALLQLGYQRQETEEVLKKVDSDQSVEAMLRQALSLLG